MTDYSQKTVLAIDSSRDVLGLGLQFGSDRLVKSAEAAERSHGQVIIKKIGELFQSAGLERNRLEAIVVATGPGSFTGLRIGLAAAKGIAVALDIPVAGVSLFEIAAHKLADIAGSAVVVVPGTRDQFFTVEVESGACDLTRVAVVSQEQIIDLSTRHPLVGIGFSVLEAVPGLEHFVDHGEVFYDVSDLLYLGIGKLSGGQLHDLSSLEPLYVQKSQAEIRFEKRRQGK